MESHSRSTAAPKELRWPSQQSLFRSNLSEPKVKIGLLAEDCPLCHCQLTASVDVNSVQKKKSGTEYSVKKHINLFLLAVILVQMYIHCGFCSALSFFGAY